MSNQYKHRPDLDKALNLANSARVNMAKLYARIVATDPCGCVTMWAAEGIHLIDEFFHDVKKAHLDYCTGSPEAALNTAKPIKDNSLINLIGEVHNALHEASTLVYGETHSEDIQHTYDCDVRVTLGNLLEAIVDIMDDDEEPTSVAELKDAIENDTAWVC